jgi:hypothetical protein
MKVDFCSLFIMPNGPTHSRFENIDNCLQRHSFYVNGKSLDVPKMWQNERLQLTNYKHVGYDNNYKINLAIFF